MGVINEFNEGPDRVSRKLRQMALAPLQGVFPLANGLNQLKEPNSNISGQVPLKDSMYQFNQKANPMQGFGGIGGIMGLLLGVGGGILANSINKDPYNREGTEAMMKAKTVEPSFYAGKGGIVGGDENVVMPVQAKAGEVAAMPTGMIVDVHADNRKHKGMGKEVTDFLPAGTYIGSDKEISKEKADKVELGHNVSEYSEFKKGKPVESIKLSELYGKRKNMTVAELLRATRNKFKVPEVLDDKVRDPFAEATANENIAQREKYVSAIMNLDMGKKSLVEQLKMMKNANTRG